MNYRYIISVLTLTIILFSSCEEFVDEPRPEAEVGVEDVFGSSEGVEAFFAGTYRAIRGFNDDMNGVTGFVNDDSEGFGSILNTITVKGNDFVQPAFQWMAFEYRYLARQNPNARKVEHIWDMSYELINSMNLMISQVEQSGFTEAQKNRYIAEARAIRAFMYFTAVREYALPYSAGSNNVGIPIYLEPASVQTEGNIRSSVGDVYEVIRGDLEFAVANLPLERDFKWSINRSVANGILARVYLHMELYDLAAQAANAARTESNSELSPENYSDGFDDMSSPEWMWGLPFSADQTMFFGSFASFWDGNRYTPTIKANETFIVNFTPTDVRNLFTLAQDAPPGLALYDVAKFDANDDFGEDVVLMRLSEMYLIEAEALARSGEFGNAATLLYELQSNRDASLSSPSGNTGQALIDEIMLERRKDV
jgi:hypothetical protein